MNVLRKVVVFAYEWIQALVVFSAALLALCIPVALLMALLYDRVWFLGAVSGYTFAGWLFCLLILKWHGLRLKDVLDLGRGTTE